jgi:hypothetical protein
MKKAGLVTLIVLLVTVFVTNAQNPKTNAGKVTKSPQGYKAPSIPTPPPQRPVKDSVKKEVPIEFIQNNDTQNSSATTVRKDGNHVLLGLGLIVGLSSGEFKEASNNNWGIGFDIHCMYNFMGTDDKDKSPVNVYLGGEFQYLYFGGKNHSVTYDDPYPYNAITNEATTSVNSNVYSLMMVSRIEFFTGPIVPFIEGAIGGRLFNGNEKVTVDRTQKPGSTLPSGVTFTPTSNTISNASQGNFVGTYGYGGGLRFTTGVISIEAKLMYMMGTTGKYIDNESIEYNQSTNKYSYQTKSSTTDMLLPQLSIGATF